MANNAQIESGGKGRNLWVSQGIVVAAVPLIGYAMAFLYEVGFCGEFGIPLEFISVNLTTVFIAVGTLLLVVAIIFYVISLLMMIPEPKHPVIRWQLSLFYVVLVMNLAVAIIFWGLWYELIMVAFLFAFFVFWIFVSPWITQKEGAYIKRVEAQRKVDSQAKTIIDYVIRYIGWGNSFVIFLVLFFVALSYIAGISHAKKQTEFLIPSTYPNSVVLRVYGDNMICAPFNAENKEVQRDFFIIKMGDDSRLILKPEGIGPLTPSE